MTAVVNDPLTPGRRKVPVRARQATTRVGWYVASLADCDTHLADRSGDALVTAQCDGRQFRPLAELAGAPPDQAQTCPACRARSTASHRHRAREI